MGQRQKISQRTATTIARVKKGNLKKREIEREVEVEVEVEKVLHKLHNLLKLVQ